MAIETHTKYGTINHAARLDTGIIAAKDTSLDAMLYAEGAALAANPWAARCLAGGDWVACGGGRRVHHISLRWGTTWAAEGTARGGFASAL